MFDSSCDTKTFVEASTISTFVRTAFFHHRYRGMGRARRESAIDQE
jgi:hypothetical protein